ncbi:MAG: TerB family tellurite resistance protein, partial [Oligoflexales bacterium]|nr:TerB family tellurite resistance protein [Oligoflexales bacterium]
IKNQKVLERFYEMQLPVDIVAALAVVPLIEVAWADGKVDEKERAKILNNSATLGIEKGSIEYQLVEQWLLHRPDPKMLSAWTTYIEGICHDLADADKKILEDTLLEHVYDVARASGGILGTELGNKVSSKEQKVIDMLSSAFRCA